MNKSIVTNLSALIVTIIGTFSPYYSEQILTAGLFALSGSITNWLAVHMLFEKVPLLYGSGIIVKRFEDFKLGIKSLIIEEFFKKNSFENFFKDDLIDKNKILEEINYDKIFDKFIESIEESSFGSMLKMVGGKKALEPLKESLILKIKEIFSDFIENNLAKEKHIDNKFHDKIDKLINIRLEELSPQDVKIIIKNIIHKHLGWLVVWGGVFGFTLGLTISLMGTLN
ncbi:MAG: DUF445 domain-containing protein [Alphaproteobacteria bacterium]|tara:strand:+ start:639 stop:1319 length:681 start_codon:yes stop_codon:yes gene_type:complete